jgi:predicted  nucleic acid-binding Zn-ribbon protein
MSEFEHSTNAKGNELQSIVDENNDLRVQLIEAKEEAAHFNNECKQLNADLQESRVIASKLEETLAQKSAELEVQISFNSNINSFDSMSDSLVAAYPCSIFRIQKTR